MSYLAFLARWYNLVFLGLALAGLAWAPLARRKGWPALGLRGILAGTALVGLSWNGAIHDLGLGSPAPRFPLVFAASLGAGFILARAVRALRRKLFPPIRGIAVNRPGLTGARGRIVSRFVGTEPGSGRAQWQDPEGVMHIVRCHTSAGSVRFGARVVLGDFDDATGSYLLAAPDPPVPK